MSRRTRRTSDFRPLSDSGTHGYSGPAFARIEKPPRRSDYHGARAPTVSVDPDALLTQREAAALLKVSASYLRASSCPKRLLPGNGAAGKPLVRYVRHEVLDWDLCRQLR